MEEQNPSICGSQVPTSETNTTLNGRGNLLEVNPDRISDLPEPLLIQILSSLDMKDAVKTGILSKRWENLWTNVDNLVYDFKWGTGERSQLRLENFISFVDRTLMLSTRPNLKKFSLSACSWKDDAYAHEVVDKWLQFLFKKNVQSFLLEIVGFGYSPHEWFYHNSSLVTLEISDWKIKFFGQTVSWTSLKTLFLSNVVIDNQLIEKILLGCPVIETLLLYEVTGISLLNIVSPSLRRLRVFQRDRDHDILAINAPWLRELEFYGTFSYVIPFLWDGCSLINATLDLCCIKFVAHGDSLLGMACRILENVHHVEELKLGKLFIQALSMTKHLGLPSPLFKCKHLTVYLAISKYELPGMARLLQSAPNLETLVIEVEDTAESNFEKHFDGIWDIKENEYLSMQMEDFPHLKNIEFEHYLRTACSVDEAQSSDKKVFDCEILAYILRNSGVKEKLVIKSRCRPLQYASLLAQKLKFNLEIDGGFEFRQKPSSFEFKFCN